MDHRVKILIALRWVEWFLSALAFGIAITYFVIDINFYYWISPVTRAQVGLTGVIHLYLYLSAIWISVKPQGFIVWAWLDIIFGMLAAAAAGTSQANLREYCIAQPLTLLWSDANFAFVPPEQRAPSDTSTNTVILTQSFNQMACGFSAAVVVCNVILIGFFVATAWLQFKQHRDDSEDRNRHRNDTEKFLHHEHGSGQWRKSLGNPFGGRRMNLES